MLPLPQLLYLPVMGKMIGQIVGPFPSYSTRKLRTLTLCKVSAHPNFTPNNCFKRQWLWQKTKQTKKINKPYQNLFFCSKI